MKQKHMYSMRIVSKQLLFVLFILCLSMVSYADNTFTCINNKVLEVNFSTLINVNGDIINVTSTQPIMCPKGCINGTTYCTGEAMNVDYALPSMLGLLLIVIIFIYISFHLREDHFFLKLLLFFVAMIFVFPVLGFSGQIARDMGRDAIAKVIDSTLLPYGIIIVIVLIYFMILILKNRMKSIKDKKERKLVGDIGI